MLFLSELSSSFLEPVCRPNGSSKAMGVKVVTRTDERVGELPAEPL